MTDTKKHLAHATAYSYAVELLLTDGASVQDLVEETGLGIVTCRKLCLCLRRREVLYIRGWDPDPVGRMVRPVYKIGTGTDKKRPAPRTASQRRKDRIARRQKEAVGLLIAQRTPNTPCDARTAIEKAKQKSKNLVRQKEKCGEDESALCALSTS